MLVPARTLGPRKVRYTVFIKSPKGPNARERSVDAKTQAALGKEAELNLGTVVGL